MHKSWTILYIIVPAMMIIHHYGEKLGLITRPMALTAVACALLTLGVHTWLLSHMDQDSLLALVVMLPMAVNAVAATIIFLAAMTSKPNPPHS